MKINSFLHRALVGGLLLTNTLFFTSCDPEPANPTPKGAYQTGVFIVNEGNFQKGNGAISYFDRDTKTVEKDIFNAVNSRPAGDVVQSMFIHNDKAYIVANNSNKVEVVDANTFIWEATISGLALPRYFAVANNKGYVTEWVGFSGNGRVAVIDLNTNIITKTIPVGSTPEQMLVVNNKLYVSNSGSNTLSVINTTTDAVETTVTVGPGPGNLVLDATSKLWVACAGNKVYKPDYSGYDENASTPGSLIRLNPATNAIEATLPFASTVEIPKDLTSNEARNKLYYHYAGKIYQLDISATTLPTNAFTNRRFTGEGFGLGVEPATGTVYAADPGFYTANGKVIRYNSTGSPLDSFEVAIGPNGFVFR